MFLTNAKKLPTKVMVLKIRIRTSDLEIRVGQTLLPKHLFAHFPASTIETAECKLKTKAESGPLPLLSNIINIWQACT